MQNFSDPQIFENDFPRRQPKHLRDRDGRPLVRDRNSFRNSKIACKIFRTRKILKTIFHGAHKTPRDRDRDPLVCDRDLLWNSKIRMQNFSLPQIFENDFPRRQPKHLRDRDGRPLVRDRSSFRNSKIACKILRTRKILKTIFHGAHQKS